ncbi:hypothetical protein [Rhodoflexus caldus]|uniref:hypothetical protein n=1 Tax=Rhodoflexus caldus TaxID=2891236 RepID=UPI00202AB077|nr:hypothetical protein [Rhodoflexus caldus]
MSLLLGGIIGDMRDRAETRFSTNQSAKRDGQIADTMRSINEVRLAQAQTGMVQAAVSSANLQTDLNAWNTIVGSGTEGQGEWLQPWFGGQKNRDFSSPMARTALFIGAGMLVLLLVVVLLSMTKKEAKR